MSWTPLASAQCYSPGSLIHDPGGSIAVKGGSVQTTPRVQDTYIATNERRYHVREWGTPANPKLLILHGVTGHSWEFDRMADRLSDSFHVYALDQRGHGASEWAADYATVQMVEDVVDVLNALDLTSVTVIGHSMGGIVGYLLAAQYPAMVDRLVVIDVGPETIAFEWGAAIADATLGYYASTSYDSQEAAVADYLRGAVGNQADELRRFVLNNLRPLEDGRWTWRFDARGIHASFGRDMPGSDAQWSALRAVTCPTLVVQGGLSQALTEDTAHRIERELQNGLVVQIDDAGHDVHIDQFEPLMQLLQLSVTAT